MYRDIAKLIMYGDIDEDCILYQMGEIFREFRGGYPEQCGTDPQGLYPDQTSADGSNRFWL